MNNERQPIKIIKFPTDFKPVDLEAYRERKQGTPTKLPDKGVIIDARPLFKRIRTQKGGWR